MSSTSMIRTPSIRRTSMALAAAGALAFTAVACADDGENMSGTENTAATTDNNGTTEPAADPDAPASEEGEQFATAQLVNQDGDDSGTAAFYDKDGKVEVHITATGLASGFHGMHLHDTGLCEDDFSSAGGHLNGDSEHGGGHPGDLPSIYINDDGTGEIRSLSDKLSHELLLDDDGAAVIVHEDPDNFAHIPERYAPDGPDEDTLSTGDAGDRELCGAIEPS